MIGEEKSTRMNTRGGLPIRNAVTAIFILLSLYLLYIYNVSQNKLHDAEALGARYRRESEERVNTIQGLISAKDEFQERCEDAKRELNNRLKSVNQKYSMLESQNSEIDADFIKLKQDMDNLRNEHMQTERLHAQEYETLKQNKEKEITELTEQLSSTKQENQNHQNSIATLQAQLQSYETAKKQLADQNAQMQMLQLQQQKQLELQKQNEANAKQAQALQDQQKHIQVGSELAGQQQQQQQQQPEQLQQQPEQLQQGQIVDSMKVSNENNAMGAFNVFDKPSDALRDQAEKIDELNSLHQAKPPGLNPAADNADKPLDSVDKVRSEEGQHEVNPNDVQHEPVKHDGGEADGEGRMGIREADEKREKEELAAEHKDPLDLGQMQQPLGRNDDSLKAKEGDGVLGQQPAPVFVEENVLGGDKALELDNSQNRAVNPVAPQ